MTLFDNVFKIFKLRFISEMNLFNKLIQESVYTDFDQKEGENNIKKIENEENNRLSMLLDNIPKYDKETNRDISLNFKLVPNLINDKSRQHGWLKQIVRYNSSPQTNSSLIYFSNEFPALTKALEPGIMINSKLIFYQNIRSILYINEKSVLIIDNFSKSYYIRFNEQNNIFFHEISKELRKLRNISFSGSDNTYTMYNDRKVINTFKFIPDFKTMEKNFSEIENSWKKCQTSTFDFLILLNLKCGRSFFDNHSYPKFPSTSFLEMNTNQHKIYFNSSTEKKNTNQNNNLQFYDFNDKKFMIPEDYFLFEKNINAYSNRKILESSPNLQKFLEAVFKIDSYKNNPSFPKVNQSQIKIPINNIVSDIRCVYALHNSNKSNVFCLIFENGIISFINVFFEKCKLKASIYGDILHVATRKNTRYYYSDKGIIAINGIFFHTIHFNNVIFGNCFSFPDPFLMTNDLISISHSLIAMYTMNDSSVISITKTILVKNKILLLASCQKNNIFVTFSDDFKIRIRKLSNGEKIKTLPFDIIHNGIPKNIVITEKWGLVVIKTEIKFLIYSCNGTFIREIEFPTIQKFFTFSTFDGFDYIIYQNSNQCIQYFDILNPDHKIDLCQNNNRVLIIQFAPYQNCFIIINDRDQIEIIPKLS